MRAELLSLNAYEIPGLRGTWTLSVSEFNSSYCVIAILHCFWSGVWFELCMLILNVRLILTDQCLYWVPSAFIKNIMNKFVVIIKLFLNIFITFI